MSSELNSPDLFAERDRAEEFCSLLIANGYLPMSEFRDILYNNSLRQEVEQRLDRVGLRLLYDLQSQTWGVGLNRKTSGDERLEWSNNLGLSRGAMALLLILWTKLVLPRKIAQQDSHSPTLSQGSLSDTSAISSLSPNQVPHVSISRDQILNEFGKVLGGHANVSKYLNQLHQARLIKYYGGVIEEGPLLSLVIREEELNEELRREVLLYTLRGRYTQPSTSAKNHSPSDLSQAEENFQDTPQEGQDLDQDFEDEEEDLHV